MVRAHTAESIMARIDTTGGSEACWVWNGKVTKDGYGQAKFQGHSVYAHRLVYELVIGPIETETLDHLCRNRLCANPRHLEPVSNRENILRGYGPAAINARMSYCRKGHVFDLANTYWHKTRRICKLCRQACDRRRRKISGGW